MDTLLPILVLILAAALVLTGWLAMLWKSRAMDLSHKEARFRAYARMSSDWYWEQDEHFRFTWLSGGIFDKAGVKAESFYGRTRWEMPSDSSPEEIAVQFAAHKKVLEAHQPFQEFEYAIRNNEETRHFSISGEPILDEQSNFKGYRGTAKDITERKRIEELIRHMAQYDALTGLPNRALFQDRLGQAIDLARRNDRKLALLYFDLDRFKPVNDQWGHHAGDALLKAVAERTLGLVRKSDTIARLGGDEFAVILQDIGVRANAGRIADKIRDSLARSFSLDDVPEAVSIGASLGIALFPEDAQNGDDLVRKADEAMYAGKHSTRR